MKGKPVRQLATTGALWHKRQTATHQNVTSKQVPIETERLARIIVFFDYSGLIFFMEKMKEKSALYWESVRNNEAHTKLVNGSSHQEPVRV